MPYKAILLGILLVLAVPAPSSALPVILFFTASISGTDLCPSSQAPRKFKDTVDITIAIDNNIADIKIEQLQNAEGDTVSINMLASNSTVNGNNTGGDFTFFSPAGGLLNGNYKGPTNDITSFTANIVAKFSDDCTKIATIKAKRIG